MIACASRSSFFTFLALLTNGGFFHTSSSNVAAVADRLLLPMFGNEFANNRNQIARHSHNDFGIMLECSFVFGNCFFFGLGLIVREKSIDAAFIPAIRESFCLPRVSVSQDNGLLFKRNSGKFP